MPVRRGMGGLSSGAGGNLFDRPGFFNVSKIDKLTVDTELLLKASSETYGLKITHADTSGNSQHYEIEIPNVSANDSFMLAGVAQILTSKTLASPKITTGIYDTNGNELLLVTATGSAVNELTLANAATSNPPVLSATGGDTNIGITLTPKGSGVVRITGGLTVDGTTTTIDSTTLTVDDKNIEMGSVTTPTDVTADGGGITLKGATDKTIIWDNTNDNWTSNQDWNIASGKVFKINNVSVLNATTLGSAVVGSSLTSVGTLASGAISSGFGAIDVGTSALTAGALTIDNISIDGNTISSSSGNITFSSASSLDFGDDAVINVGTITIDAIYGDNNAIQVGDNSDDAVSIYRVNAFTAIGDLDIGAHDFRAATITPDGLTAGRVVFAGTNGVLSDDSDLTFATATLTATNISSGSVAVDNITINGNTISSTDTNGVIVLAPHGTGDVQLDADTVRVGDSNAIATITTNGAGSLKLNTNSGTNSGTIIINDGANGSISINPHGTGYVGLGADTVTVGDENALATITTLGTGSLKLNTNAGTNTGHIQITAGANGAIDITPNGTGDVNITKVDIDSGTVDAITSLTVANDVDVGNYKVTAKVFEASDLTAGRITFAGTNGLLADDSDLTFATDTLTATNIVIPDTGSLVIGHTAQLVLDVASEFQIHGTAISDSSIGITHWGTGYPAIRMGRSTSTTIGSWGDGQVPDAGVVGGLEMYVDDGSGDAQRTARILAFVDDASLATNQVGTKWVFETTTTGGAGTAGLIIDAAQDVFIPNGDLKMGAAATGNAQIDAAVSSTGNPVYTFIGDTNTGLARGAADQLELIVGGTRALTIVATQVQVQQPIYMVGTGLIQSDQATATVFNTNSTTVNAFGAANTITMGAADGLVSIVGGVVLGHTSQIQVGGSASSGLAELQVHGTDYHDSTVQIGAWRNDGGYPSLRMSKSRGTTVGAWGTIVAVDDALMAFEAYADNGVGTTNEEAARLARILCMVENVTGSNIGTKWSFSTSTASSAETVALIIDSSQDVTIPAGSIAMGVVSDPSTVTDQAHIYVKDDPAEVYVRDEAGNVTKISPHNDIGEWEFHSYNDKTGKSFKVNMEHMIRKLEDITGESFIQEDGAY